MKKLEHIGIAVKDLEAAKAKYKVILGVACYKEEVVESENVLTAFFQTADQKIELLQATSNDSAIAKFIEQRGEGMHHIAFEVDDLDKEIERLKTKGYHTIIKPKAGADNKAITFLHPKDANGVLIELCQSNR